jgi:hypothetical protein
MRETSSRQGLVKSDVCVTPTIATGLDGPVKLMSEWNPNGRGRS